MSRLRSREYRKFECRRCDLARACLDRLELLVLVEDGRVQVAVTGVTDGGDIQTQGRGDLSSARPCSWRDCSRSRGVRVWVV